MADILSFNNEDLPLTYSVDVRLFSKEIEFTVHGVDTDMSSRLRVAEELERIARIIRSDAITGC